MWNTNLSQVNVLILLKGVQERSWGTRRFLTMKSRVHWSLLKKSKCFSVTPRQKLVGKLTPRRFWCSALLLAVCYFFVTLLLGEFAPVMRSSFIVHSYWWQTCRFSLKADMKMWLLFFLSVWNWQTLLGTSALFDNDTHLCLSLLVCHSFQDVAKQVKI